MRKMVYGMKRIRLVAFALAFCILIGCSKTEDSLPHTAKLSAVVSVTGDVANAFNLESFNKFTVSQVKYDSESFDCISLGDVISEAGVLGEDCSVFLSAPDGVMAQIPIDQAMDCYLTLRDERGWECIAPYHPPQVNIKRIDQIVVCAQEPSENSGVRFIMAKTTFAVSYGDLFASQGEEHVILEGSPIVKKNDLEFNANAYSRRTLIPIKNFTEQDGTAKAYFGDGSEGLIEQSGYIEWRGNSADYIAPNRRNRMKDIICVWVDAPEYSITDVAANVLKVLEQDEKVMLIELDGAGWQAIEYAKAQNRIPFLSGYSAQPISTVYPCISNVALASLLTGQTPDKTTVTQRSERILQVDDIFNIAAQSGKTGTVIEGNSKLVDMSIQQLLNVDTNENGSTDDEVFACAKKQLGKFDFTFVHFHGIDDTAHTYGPFSQQSLDKLSEIDGFIQALCIGFDGTIIITADHGQHDVQSETKSGDHGTFNVQDMIVPLIEIKQ